MKSGTNLHVMPQLWYFCTINFVSDVMPIYMIMPRYSHNYALFYQLLDGNLFTHRNTYAILSMAPGSILHHISLHLFYFTFYTFNLYHKNTKNIILSSLSDLTFASGREGIDNPFIALVAWFLFVCVGTRDSRVVSYWIDTLVLKN